MDKKNSDGWDEDVKACEDLFAGCPQLLVGELHQGHQVVRVLRNKSWEYCKNLARTQFFKCKANLVGLPQGVGDQLRLIHFGRKLLKSVNGDKV